MISLVTSPEAPTCEREDWLCRSVRDLTGNNWAAAAADWLVAKPAVILFILVLGLIARWLAFKVIGRLVARASIGVAPPVGEGRLSEPVADTATTRIAAARRKQRAETMGTVLKSVTTFAVVTVVLIMVLAEFEVNIGPLLAGAGILGLAVGFGAQALVQDFFAGIFMLFEDQYGIGDVVDLGEATGVVEAVTLRVTRLRDVNGTVWYIRNGEVMRVGNMSQNWARTVLDVSVAYGEDLARVRAVLEALCHEMWAEQEFRERTLEEPEVWGVERMEADGIAVRVAIKTAPLEQWAVARILRQRIKERFDREGIEIPFPQRVLWHRDPPAGPAQATAAGETDH